ncbi:1-phosphofructokinase family hexose kinase [Corynebacterium crudilactis]|uniref:Fructose-1-phosphate kinase n=1 Tax=Corynebacterium crudilactis TaxID=1652495 RepID=A0A172QU83_9CORY|nr:1-phosphofructokinase family hexose kinase [Corynebacterium crudilactis]ANE04210.1 fructose-1-phosphate kinase [Corynebacterium crudilactis]
MILTVTASPYLLSTNELDGHIEIGEANKIRQVSTVAGGFGTGVAATLFYGGNETFAVFPAPEISHYLRLVTLAGLPHEIIPVAGPIPMHLTMRDVEGNETKFKDSPMPLDVSQLAILRDLVVRRAEEASWVLLGGNLPSVAPAAWFVDVVRSLRLYHPDVKVAIAATGAALRAVIRQLAATSPDLLIVAAEEIEKATELEPKTLRNPWADGDLSPTVAAARALINSGVTEVVVTNKRTESLYVSASDALLASYASAPGKQGVNWRESFSAGFLAASNDGKTATECLINGVAYANAEGSEWDNYIPTPDRLQAQHVVITPLA